MMRRALLGLLILLAASCSREPGLFVEANARTHINMLADSIGSRPVGTPANARAREYIVDELRQIGLEVRVQEVDARRHEAGLTARVANIIGVLPGERPEAVALVTHYDSSPDAPGASDAALGVGVAIEAARVLASRPARRWTLLVLVTDGEEVNLMGAAGLVTDREIVDRLHACINLDAIGSDGTAILFETGEASAPLVRVWARHAPHPRGGSFATEIYQRLPNDTDFSIFRARGIPGLNFAPALDSYAYHTARDTPDRLSRYTVRTTGENVVAILSALQEVDITERTAGSRTFFDIGGTVAVSYGHGVHVVLAGLALLLGAAGWLRVTSEAVRQNGALPWLLAFVWTWVGAVLTAAAMVGATWLLREAREVYHPWYARPEGLFVLLVLVGVTTGWIMVRLAAWLPRGGPPGRHPALAWSIALPAWLILAATAVWYVPAAAYLWVLPVLAAGVLLSLLPPRLDGLIRIASLCVLAVAATLWLRETHDMLRFTVAMMARQPIVTPVATYAALLAAAAIMIVPPIVALLASGRRLARPGLVTVTLLIATAAAGGAAYVAPAYTTDRPLRRDVRALQEPGVDTATWEVGSVEPGLDLPPEAPGGWTPAATPVPGPIPWERLRRPFVFRTEGPPLGPAPLVIAAFELTPEPDGLQLRLSIVPQRPGLLARFVLPADIVPVRSSLPGRMRLGRWTATFSAIPAEGVAWDALFTGVTAEALRETRIAITDFGFPGGEGWQRLPAWLPQERSVWSAAATWVVPATGGPDIAPVPPLR
jgi:hypothetical protein